MYRLKYCNGHIYTEIDGSDWLIDTGSPASFGKIDTIKISNKTFSIQSSLLDLNSTTLSEYVKYETVGLLGTDILNEFNIIFNIKNQQINFSTDKIDLDGEIITLDDVMGIPVVVATVKNNNSRMFFDTGAQISYIQKEDLSYYDSLGTVKDFYPGVGQFETDTAIVDLQLGNLGYKLKCGSLPEMLNMTLLMTQINGIIGNEIMSDAIVGYFPKDCKLIFSLNKEKDKSTLAEPPSDTRPHSSIINNLIKIGKDYEYLHIENIFEDKNLIVFSAADQHKIYNYFMRGPHGYTSDELSNILKGTIVCEIKHMNNKYGYGSVSATIAITFALIAVDYKQAEKMMKWAEVFGFYSYYFGYGQSIRKSPELYAYILRYSLNNESIEFAKRALESYEKYKQYIEDKEKQRSEKTKKRKIYTQKLISNDIEDRKNGLRKQLIEKLNSLSSYEKLVVMAEDTRHSVKYYPTNIAYAITKEDIVNLNKEQQSNLFAMTAMRLKSSTPWGVFKKKFNEVFCQ